MDEDDDLSMAAPSEPNSWYNEAEVIYDYSPFDVDNPDAQNLPFPDSEEVEDSGGEF